MNSIVFGRVRFISSYYSTFFILKLIITTNSIVELFFVSSFLVIMGLVVLFMDPITDRRPRLLRRLRMRCLKPLRTLLLSLFKLLLPMRPFHPIGTRVLLITDWKKWPTHV